MSRRSAIMRDYLPARYATGEIPWLPAATPGKSSRPLRFLADDRPLNGTMRFDSPVYRCAPGGVMLQAVIGAGRDWTCR